MFVILRILFWGAYLHNYVSEFMRQKNTIFPIGRIVTRLPIIHVIKSKFPSYRYAPDCTFFKSKIKKLPSVGGGKPPSHTLPPLGRYAPSQRLCAPQFSFGSLCHCHWHTGGGTWSACPPPNKNKPWLIFNSIKVIYKYLKSFIAKRVKRHFWFFFLK